MLFYFFSHFPSDKPQVCLLTPLICLVWARCPTQSTRMAHNEAGTVPGSPRLITVSTVMALHCCGGTMLLSAVPLRPSPTCLWSFFSLSVSDGPSRRAGMIDDADQEGNVVPVLRWVTPSANYRLKEWLSSGSICEFISNFCRSSTQPVPPLTTLLCLIYSFKGQQRTPVVFISESKALTSVPPAVWLATGLLTHVTPCCFFQIIH